MCFSCICLFILNASIFCPFSLLLVVREWLRLVIVTLPGLLYHLFSLLLRWVYTIKVNLVKLGQTLIKMLFTLSKLFKVFNYSFKILAGTSHYTLIFPG